jgi:hypothetical protein
MESAVTMAKTTFIGVCLTAFSCGIMGTVAIDHYWPRARPECAGAQVISAGVAPPMPVEPGPANAPEAAAVAAIVAEPLPEPAAIAVAEPTPAPVAAVPPKTTAPPRTARPSKTPSPPKVAVTPTSATPKPLLAAAAAPSPAARVLAPASPPPSHGAAPGRPAPAQGRAAVRKRPGSAVSAAGGDGKTMSPTEVWIDPFEQ